MTDSSDEFFFDNVINTLSDNSDDESEIMIAVDLLINEQEVNQIQMYKGSMLGRNAALDHSREAGHDQLWRDYFHRTNHLFKPPLFRRRLWMSRKVFLRILHKEREYDDYFRLKKDATCKLDFSSYKTCTVVVRILAYGVVGDLVDEYMRMSEATCLESMYKFCKAVVQVFAGEYLRGNQMLPSLPDYCRPIIQEAFLVCLDS
jgi:hypothetical protein